MRCHVFTLAPLKVLLKETSLTRTNCLTLKTSKFQRSIIARKKEFTSHEEMNCKI